MLEEFKSKTLRSIYAYPWDIAATGVTNFLNEISDLGLNGVTLAMSYHAGKFLSPTNRQQRVVFPEDGVVYFEPTMERYSVIKPQPHSNPHLRSIYKELLDDGRLQLRAWTVLLHNSRLGEQHPEFVARNAWGDGYVYSLCPSFNEVFDFAVQLSVDTAAQGVTGLVLESPNWAPFAHGYHHEFAQLRSNIWLETLLGLCFCNACRQRATAVGINANVLAKTIQSRVDAYLAAPVDASPAQAQSWLMADLLQMPDLAAFLHIRQCRVTELVAAIRQHVPKTCEVMVIPTVQRPTASTWLEGTDLAELAKVCDGLEVPFYEASAAHVAADVFDTLQRVGKVEKVRAILRPGPPDLGDGMELVAAINTLKQQGIRDISFYNYGLLRPHYRQNLGACIAHTS